MRTLLVVLLLAICSQALAIPHTQQEREFVFTSWIKEHKRLYSDLQEFQTRFQIFVNNWNIVEAHNKEAQQGKHTFFLGLNHFADMTNEEYQEKMLGLNTRPNRPSATPFEVTPEMYEALPDTVDWRQQGVVTGVKDQGQCGSCWAFSAVGSMEGAHAYATKQLVSLSEQELVDCANGGQNTCDVGGWMTDGFTWGISNGMESEADYPYQASSGNACQFSASKVKAKFSGYSNVTVGSEADLQVATANQPTVSVAIDASSIWFQLYSSGVYNDPSCGNTIDSLDHGVLVVGYGTYNGADYWLVKNSWGTIWGMQGYIMMSRNNNNQCGIATDASFPLV